MQSDKLLNEITDLGDLERKLCSFGWQVLHCNGHDFQELQRAFAVSSEGQPKLILAEVIIQPRNPDETRMALQYRIEEAKTSCVLRLVIGPVASPNSPGRRLPAHFRKGH